MHWKWPVTIMGGVATLAGIGAMYQAQAAARAAKDNPPPGKLVDVGGHRLHITCMGEGSPTVVLEAGLSCTSLDWSHVLPAIAQFTRVCAYDRAGCGWSDPGPWPRTGQTIVNELHTLLDEGGVTGPLVLVGHSYGGLLVRLYASYYPDAVAGLVLVDAAHEDQRLYSFGQAWHIRLMDKIRWQSFRLNPLCARLG
jgi:pimeloyl-ACP methyl ester carboxylesterase